MLSSFLSKNAELLRNFLSKNVIWGYNWKVLHYFLEHLLSKTIKIGENKGCNLYYNEFAMLKGID